MKVKGHTVAYAGENGLSDSLKIETALITGAGDITIYNNPNINTLRIGSTTEPDNRKLDADYTPHPDLHIKGSRITRAPTRTLSRARNVAELW